MFTWICPQCGREVPPAYTECPDCVAKASGAGGPTDQQAQPAPAYPPPPPPGQAPQYPPMYGQPPYPPPQYGYAQPPYPGQPYPPQYQPYPPPPYPTQQYQQTPYGQPPYAPPPPPPGAPGSDAVYAAPPPPHPPVSSAMTAPATVREPIQEPMRETPAASSLFAAPPVTARKAPMPTWLLTILCTAGFALIVVGAYWLFGSHNKTSASQAAAAAPAANAAPAAASPWQKFIEVSGVRLQENPKKKNEIVAKFIVTNHSESDLPDLAGNVTVKANSGGDPQGSFTFKTSIGPYGSKEMTEPFQTNLKVYELPDWNVSHADLVVTNPPPPGSGGQQ